jgi:hypothetical protein
LNPIKTKTSPVKSVVSTPPVSSVQASTVPTSGPAVKKSSTGLCHAQGTRYYAQTLTYTSYASIEACLTSGGKLPK